MLLGKGDGQAMISTKTSTHSWVGYRIFGMNSRTFITGLWIAVFSWLVCFPSFAADEKARIEGLITHVEQLKGASFIRNGKSYEAKDAAKFLRRKWQSKEKEIKTAEQFIEKVATVSGTTGKPYKIKFNDGREVKCGDYLKEQLK